MASRCGGVCGEILGRVVARSHFGSSTWSVPFWITQEHIAFDAELLGLARVLDRSAARGGVNGGQAADLYVRPPARAFSRPAHPAPMRSDCGPRFVELVVGVSLAGR
jgi:hypothetical protein